MLRWFFLIAVIALWPMLSGAEAASPSQKSFPKAKAERTAETIKIDGRLDETVWQNAVVYSDFTQRKPYVGKPASQKTEFSLLFDDHFIYIGVRCFDTQPEKIIARTKRFDSNRLFDDDWLSIKIDPTYDRRTTYYFAVTPLGTPYDAKVLNDGAQWVSEWDTVWQVKARKSEAGWQAEFRIPFTSLEYDASKGKPIGLNVTRGIGRIPEEADWSEIPPPFEGLQANYYGTLKGINLPPGPWRSLSLWPYVSSGFDQDMVGTTTGNNPGGLDFVLDLGFDLKYPLTRSAIIQGTVKTDFSQVDIDDAQINLNRFSLYYPELRPFFLEGAQFFDYGIPQNTQLFFSRRIGIDDNNDVVPILAGVRSYGTFGRSEYGFFNIQAEETGSVPGRNFSLARFRQNVLTQSEVGAMVTHQQDTNGGNGFNTGFGVDGYLRSKDNRLTLNGWASGTVSEPDTQLNPNGIDGFGSAAFLRGVYTPGLWRAALANLYVSDDYNPEMGFLNRSGIFSPSLSLSRSFRWAEHGINEFKISSYEEMVFNDGVSILQDYSANLFFTVTTNPGYRFIVGGTYFSDDVLDPFDVADEVTIPAGRYSEGELSITANTPAQHNIRTDLTYKYAGYFGGTKHQLLPTLVVRPLPTLYLNGGANISLIDIPDLAADFTTAALNASASYSLTTNMYLDANVAWNHSSNELVLQGRYRWRFRPLSDFFIVYREEHQASDFATTFRSLVFKIVLSWRFKDEIGSDPRLIILM